MTSSGPFVLIVDDRQDVLSLHSEILSTSQYSVTAVSDPEEAFRLVTENFFDLLVLDDRMPGMNGRELFRKCREIDPDIGAIFVSAHSDVETLAEVMRLGASDYVVKSTPDFPTRLSVAVESALESTRQQRRFRWFRRQFDTESGESMEMLGTSPAMDSIRKRIRKVATSEFDVLISGETGTGKELAARAIHDFSARRDATFLPCNLGALESTLITSELFGAIRGAFTGAEEARIGYFEAADGGTLFLDEIGELPLNDQPKLLRVLESRRVQPVGSTAERTVDLRVVAATNRDLSVEVARGRFREDLYHRLDKFSIQLPPLRSRGDDVVLLTERFVSEFSDGKPDDVTTVSPAAIQKLNGHPWPGNVRELRNVVERAVFFAESSELAPDDFELKIPKDLGEGSPNSLADLPFKEAKKHFEYEYCVELLDRTGGNRTEAAKEAKLNRSSFLDLMRRTGLQADSRDADDNESNQR